MVVCLSPRLRLRDCLSPPRLLPSALFHSATSGKRAKWTPHVSNQVVPCLDPSEGENVHVSCDGRYRTRATYPAAAPDPADPSPPPLRPLVVSPLQTLTPIRNSQNNSRKSRRISLQTTPWFLLWCEPNSINPFLGGFFSFECGYGRAVMQ